MGGALSGFKSHRKILKNAANIKIPVTIFTAGLDTLIDDEGYEKFAAKVPQARIIPYEKAKHEIFNADDESRISYFNEVLKRI